MLIQHNPNEGLKPLCFGGRKAPLVVLIQHNPNEGLKQKMLDFEGEIPKVLIQHNPNEGLKPGKTVEGQEVEFRAHSAQPERGIETCNILRLVVSCAVLIQHNPNEGLKQISLLTRSSGRECSFSTTRTRD